MQQRPLAFPACLGPCNRWTIHDAHPTGVTAVAGTPDSRRVISGGKDGTVRVWRIGRDSQVLEHSMKEHKASVGW